MARITNRKRVINTTVLLMRIDAVFWILLAILQIVIGAPLIVFLGYGFLMIGCGIWNIFASIRRLKTSSVLKRSPSMIYPYFNGSFDAIMYCLVYNVIFGGLIGVFGCIFDLLLREYVIKRKELLTSHEYSYDD